jgi:hypothetical protein
MLRCEGRGGLAVPAPNRTRKLSKQRRGHRSSTRRLLLLLLLG